MALNAIMPINTKIQEVSQCEPISSPSSTSLEDHKTFPDINSYLSKRNYFFNNNNSLKKNKSLSPRIKYENIFDDIFYNNEIENLNINLNIEQEKKNISKKKKINYNMNKDRSSASSNSNISSKKNQKMNSLDLDENLENNIIYAKLKKNNNKKKEEEKDSFIEEMNNIENKIKSINTEENENSILKRKIPKMDLKFNEKNKNKNLYNNNTYNDSVRYSNPNGIKIGIYHRKKILDSKTYGKIGKYEGNITTESSIKRDSIKSDYYLSKKNNNMNMDININNKKRPLTLNINIGKKNIEKIKISQIQKIIKDDGFFNILQFLNYKEFLSLLKARNKKLIILINTAFINAYYYSFKESLSKYNNIFQILKCSLVYSKIKEALKIDFVINFKFINEKKELNNKIKLGPNNIFKEPVYCQFGYIYSYFPKTKNKKELLTKEEYEKQIKRTKLYDYYTFDLYPEKNKYNFLDKKVYISKELSLFEKDGNNNIVNIQPILPFSLNDKGIINLELFTSNNGYVDPLSIKIIAKVFNLKNYLKALEDKKISNPRISECEEICAHWKNINLYQLHKQINSRIKKLFEPYFEIKKIYFGNIGVTIFRVELLAIKSGEINNKNRIEIKIRVKEKDDYIENEIRKNNLLFERRDIFEIRVGDCLLYYFSLK